jgi:octanoyl-[GcvH]:protein N-octanoyltransferase
MSTGPYSEADHHTTDLVDVMDESEVDPTETWRPPTVTSLGPAPDRPTLRLYRPLPTAAFSQRDALLPGYPRAEAVARELGFEPVKRTVGGRMAPLHEDTLVIDLIVAHPKPNVGTRQRFESVATAVCAALQRMDVPARIGEIPGEYCPGEFSVNAGGKVKLAGIAQRVTRWGFLVSTVLVLGRPDPLRAVVEGCYQELGLPVDPSVVGAVSDFASGVSRTDIAAILGEEMSQELRRWK